jgi:2'-5' RNA ligase
VHDDGSKQSTGDFYGRALVEGAWEGIHYGSGAVNRSERTMSGQYISDNAAVQYTNRSAMRLFTAIDIPGEVQSHLRALLDRLRPAAKLGWSTVEKLHITTKFIGEWPEDRLEEMKAALGKVVAPGEVRIAVRGLGWFPNPRNPRVFWAGVEGGDQLKSLARATEQAAGAIGVPVEDREYTPHLTLARVRDRVPLDALVRTNGSLTCTDFGSFPARSFYLYLSRAGQYSKLAEFALT